MKFSTALALAFLEFITAQQIGKFEIEDKPTITLKECTLADGCTSRQAKLTLDANWRWIHSTTGSQNCYTGNKWDPQFCTDPSECAKNCALEGVTSQKYGDTYGIKQVKDGVQMDFVTTHQYGTNVGSRLYVMANDDEYQLFKLKNREYSFEVDVSHLQCGMNGAMYFSEMAANGGLGLGDNNAGAKYGTGYCDAQCPHDMKFIAGEANVVDWKPNPNDLSENMGSGKYGACCVEMDIWEANSMATAYTPHTCGVEGQYRCEGIACGDNDKGHRYDGVCDKDGCDINPYRMGNTNFYGRGPEFTINTLRPMTVVTQFITNDGTDSGDLSEIRRLYVQDGNIIDSPSSTILGTNNADSITDKFCDDKKNLFNDVNDFQEKGGMRGMGESLDRGHVMVFSLWDDVEVNMLWLDSAYPLKEPTDKPGIKRGACPGGENSTPTFLRENFPDAYVTFKNAAVGEIGSTYGPVTPTSPSPNPPTTTPRPNQRPPTSPPVKGPCGSGCCSQNFKDCISWCGGKKSECLSCNQDVAWINCPGQNCVKRYDACTGNAAGCCDGLTCVDVNSNYSQCQYVKQTDSPTNPPSTISPSTTPPPTAMPTSLEDCVPAGSNCFVKQKNAGCDDASCEQEVCKVRGKCCNNKKKWDKKCANKAAKKCTPCLCREAPKDFFFLEESDSNPNGIRKTCDWLSKKNDKKKERICNIFSSFKGFKSARFVCPLTCGLPTCTGDNSIFQRQVDYDNIIITESYDIYTLIVQYVPNLE